MTSDSHAHLRRAAFDAEREASLAGGRPPQAWRDHSPEARFPVQRPGDLHPVLRTAWDFAEQVRATLLGIIHPLTAVRWVFRPAAQAWCIGEQVEHLLRAEIGSSKMVRKLIRGDFRGQHVPAGVTPYTAALDRYPFGALEAPPALVPGPVRNREILERELTEAHARFRSELAAFQGDDPEALRAPDPATGVWFTLGGWVKLQVWHEAHHLTQIQRIVAAPTFPR